MNLSDDFVLELQKILKSESLKPVMDQVKKVDQQMGAAAQRNEVQADWLSSVFDRLYSKETTEAHKINSSTGNPHTVESMVNEYKKKIGLEFFENSRDASADGAILSTASSEHEPPLSVRKKNKKAELSKSEMRVLWSRICEFIDALLKSHNGYIDAPAIFDDIRQIFDLSVHSALPEAVKEEISKRKQRYFDTLSFGDGLPEIPLSEPMKVGDDQGTDNNMFSNINISGPTAK